MLSDKEINLEDKEAQLTKKNAELEEFAKRLNEEKIEFSVREAELEDTKAKLNRDSEFLAAQNKEFLNDKKEFEDYRASVQRQSEEARRIMNDADEKLKLAQSLEDKNTKRERELSEREKIIADELSRINIDKAEILTAKKDTQEKAEAAEKKLAELNSRENDLKTARSIFDDEKKKIAEDTLKLKEDRKEAERIIAEVKTLMAEAERKTKIADAISEKNQELETTIAKLTSELKLKQDELDNMYKVKPGALKAELPSDIPANASLTLTDNGIINWSDGSIRAKGMGIVPPDKTEAQGKALARRAAIADLQRNLLETVQGVQLDSSTKIVDYITVSDTIRTAVSGTIRGVEVVEENFDGETYTIAGQIRQEILAKPISEISKKLKVSTRRPKEPKQKTGKFTGLIIDATALAGLQQQKLLRIVDEKGEAVYGSEFADKNIQAKNGLCAYFDNMVFTSDENSRVGKNPLVIKAQRLSNDNAHIVIPNWAANEIRKNAIDFRKECRVIIVKS